MVVVSKGLCVCELDLRIMQRYICLLMFSAPTPGSPSEMGDLTIYHGVDGHISCTNYSIGSPENSLKRLRAYIKSDFDSFF